tara:strand:+ start:10056 stop:10259 length:204 start_codon:yes stop_codon:yes gene_type:complete
MNRNEIIMRINDIKELRGDDESAHSLEDELYYDFIEYLSTACVPLLVREKAKLILTTKKINFSRWCA